MIILTLLLPLVACSFCFAQSPPPEAAPEAQPVPPLTAVTFTQPGWYMVQVQQDGSATTLHLTGLQVDEGRITQRLDAIAAKLDQVPPPEVRPEPSSPFPIDLNSAAADLLQLLPGVGPAIAQRILDLRAARGGYFDSAGELVAVRGISTAMVEDWDELGLVTVIPRSGGGATSGVTER